MRLRLDDLSMRLLTIKEAAAEIRMSEGWLKKAIRDGKLRVLRFGRSVRIQPEALADYIQEIVVTTQSRERKLRAVEQQVRRLSH